MADRVFGVMVDWPLLPLFMMARKAAVPGEGGKATGPPTRGVKPVPGVRPVLGVMPVRGVRPVRKELPSNWRWEDWSLLDCGPASMAGERGPARRELLIEEFG